MGERPVSLGVASGRVAGVAGVVGCGAWCGDGAGDGVGAGGCGAGAGEPDPGVAGVAPEVDDDAVGAVLDRNDIGWTE
jgi:hypothetical protein